MLKQYGLQNGNCLYLFFILDIGSKISNIKYYIYRNEISSKDIICDLGVRISNDLSFNDHIYITCMKACWVINNIFYSFSCEDTSIYVKTYSAYLKCKNWPL